GDGTTAIQDADIEDGEAVAEVGGIQGQDELVAGPILEEPGEQDGGEGVGVPVAPLHAPGAAAVALLGRSLVIPFLEASAQGEWIEGEPTDQGQDDGVQGARACQDDADAPQGQALRLRPGEAGQM